MQFSVRISQIVTFMVSAMLHLRPEEGDRLRDSRGLELGVPRVVINLNSMFPHERRRHRISRIIV